MFQEVVDKVDLVFDEIGERQLKNIARPVRIYRVTTGSEPLVDVSIPVTGFSGRPAIAVLPPDNISGEPQQGFFAGGLTEDLILRLSYWRWFPVIARNSLFVFKGNAVDVQDVGQSWESAMWSRAASANRETGFALPRC